MLTQARLKELLSYDPETGNFVRLVSASNSVRVGDIAGTLDSRGYIRINVLYKSYLAHRLAFLYVTGKLPKQQIDHIDGNKVNNIFANLRDVNYSINNQNKRFARSDSKTGLLGASPRGNRFVAQIRLNGKNHHIGIYSTAELAHTAYIAAKRRLHPGCTI